jgi:maltokinase
MTVVTGPDLGPLLTAFLPAQRWYAGRGRDLAAVRVLRSTMLGDELPVLLHVLAEVAYADGGVERYQVPLGLDDRLPEGMAGAGRLGPADLDGRELVAYDAAHDPRLARLLLDLVAARAEVDGLSFRSAGDARALAPAGEARVMSAEQSNTSIVFGDELILKLFRKVQEGLNPELELTRALDRQGFASIARPVGWIECDDPEATLGMVQPFYPGSSEGWALAVEHSRAGRDFSGPARELGRVTGEMHVALAAALPTVVAGEAEAGVIRDRRRAELAETIAVAPELAARAAAIEAVLAAGDPAGATLQRIHGDYHLGQVLRTGEGRWVILDFEGEPTRPIPERRLPDSALRDVAGMLRSFDYAASYPGVEEPGSGAADPTAWAEQARSAFLAGYLESNEAGGAGASGPGPALAQLAAYELDKALYEVRYEARYRPQWLAIPLAGIDRLLAAAPKTKG